MKNFKIKLSGSVQGVGLRVSCKSKADELGLTGFVRNEPDGTASLEIEGTQALLDQFLFWLDRDFNYFGPHELQIFPGEVRRYSSFSIEFVR